MILLSTTLADVIIMHPTKGFPLPTLLTNLKILFVFQNFQDFAIHFLG
jgi:hypothetical protein